MRQNKTVLVWLSDISTSKNTAKARCHCCVWTVRRSQVNCSTFFFFFLNQSEERCTSSVAEDGRCRTLAVWLRVGLLATAAAWPGSSRLGPAPHLLLTQSGRSFSALTWRRSTGRRWAADQGRDDLPDGRQGQRFKTIERIWFSETFKNQNSPNSNNFLAVQVDGTLQSDLFILPFCSRVWP